MAMHLPIAVQRMFVPVHCPRPIVYPNLRRSSFPISAAAVSHSIPYHCRFVQHLDSASPALRISEGGTRISDLGSRRSASWRVVQYSQTKHAEPVSIRVDCAHS